VASPHQKPVVKDLFYRRMLVCSSSGITQALQNEKKKKKKNNDEFTGRMDSPVSLIHW
jgi:hypothetical protein